MFRQSIKVLTSFSGNQMRNAIVPNLIKTCVQLRGISSLDKDSRKLRLLKEKYSKYVNNNYVFKICYNKCKSCHMIVLKKLSDTKDNESREGIKDINYAKFRADKLEVVEIIDMKDYSNSCNSISNFNWTNGLKYIKNKIVIPDSFDNNLNRICSNGIHYFKTIDAAFYYRSSPVRFSGVWKEFDGNGSLYAIVKYSNGLKKEEYEFSNGKKNGKCTIRYIDGQLLKEGCHLNDSKHGIWIEYDLNGKMKKIYHDSINHSYYKIE
jgi:antitoxin component YwqK of YwqJK toxin-antitoxin module